MSTDSQSGNKQTNTIDVNRLSVVESNLSDKPLAIRFDVSSGEPFPLRVEMVKDTKSGFQRWRVIVIIVFAIIIIAGASLYLIYINPKNAAQAQDLLPQLVMTYIYPSYLSIGDQNIVDITLTNLHPSQTFNGSITLFFIDPTIPIIPASEQNFSVVIQDLRPGDRAAGQIRFSLPEVFPDNNFIYYFQVFHPDGTPYTSPTGTPYRSVEKEFKLAPIPNLQKILALVFGSMGVVSLIWEQLSKLLRLD